MDLRRLITVFRAWLPLIAAATVVAGAVAFIVSSIQPKIYEAKATLIVGQSLSAANPDYNQLLVAAGLSTTYAAIAETRPILENVIENLGLEDTTKDLSDRVRIDVPRDSTLLTISAEDTDPERAAAIANELGAQLIAASPAIRGREAELQEAIDRDLAATQVSIEQTQAQIQELSAIENRTPAETAELQSLEGRLISLRSTFASLLPLSTGSASNVLTVVEPADAPSEPVSPLVLLNTLLAAALGLLAVAGVAFVSEQLDDFDQGSGDPPKRHEPEQPRRDRPDARRPGEERDLPHGHAARIRARSARRRIALSASTSSSRPLTPRSRRSW